MTAVLVANRGEIARRVFRTAKRLGFRTVAVFSAADSQGRFVSEADEAVALEGGDAAEPYLDIDLIVQAAKATEADMIHPGYGFLAEDPALAEACEAAGVGFVGPPPSVLRRLGSKDSAREVAEQVGAPLARGYFGDQDDDALIAAAEEIGYPIVLKPVAGGGGKGMSVVRSPDELADALASARRVAQRAFGDERLMAEQFLEDSRHIEVQIFGDTHGNVCHLFERDCSVQRRYQKVIEETPAPNLPPDFEVAELWEAAVAIGRHVGYVGAGTCEFVVSSSGVASFLEVNARLQVEHPVTEAVTGLDLVEWQLRVAMGERLPLSQDEIVRKGSAIEARVYAEDPTMGFLPRSGKLVRLEWPSDVRIDSGFDEGDEVGDRYDPLISKVIAMGTDRAEALARLDRALSTTVLLGVVTNLGMLRDVVRNPAFVQGGVTTDWLESIIDDAQGDHPIPEVVMQIAAAAEGSHLASVGSLDPFVSLAGWRLGGGRTFQIVLREATQEETHSVEVSEPVRVDGRQVAKGAPGEWLVDGRTAKVARDGDAWFIEWESQFYEVGIGEVERSVGADAAKLEAPLPGQVIEVRISEGEKVAANQPLVIVEAMKMEHTIRAPTDGTVTAVMCAVGQQVNRGQSLVEFDAD